MYFFTFLLKNLVRRPARSLLTTCVQTLALFALGSGEAENKRAREDSNL